MQLYVIESLKWSNTANYNGTAYWGPNNNGYTSNIGEAGIYTEEQVMNNQDYYNNGRTTKAIKLDVTQCDWDTVERMMLSQRYVEKSLVEYEEHIERTKQKLESLQQVKEEALRQKRENLFNINQQLLLYGKELLK